MREKERERKNTKLGFASIFARSRRNIDTKCMPSHCSILYIFLSVRLALPNVPQRTVYSADNQFAQFVVVVDGGKENANLLQNVTCSMASISPSHSIRSHSMNWQNCAKRQQQQQHTGRRREKKIIASCDCKTFNVIRKNNPLFGWWDWVDVAMQSHCYPHKSKKQWWLNTNVIAIKFSVRRINTEKKNEKLTTHFSIRRTKRVEALTYCNDQMWCGSCSDSSDLIAISVGIFLAPKSYSHKIYFLAQQ